MCTSGTVYWQSMAGEIRIGTSGYSFKDWVGTVYPAGTRASEYLRYYVKDFDTVEMNATFYRVPSPDVTARIAQKVPNGFCFTVKAPRTMSHERKRFDEAKEPFLRALAPLQDAGMLGGVLVQFPQSFHLDAHSVDVLPRLADAFRPAEYSVFVEFRHRSWCQDAVYEQMEQLGLGVVNVDLPAIGTLPRPSAIVTTDRAYVRLHGRNRDMWYRHPTPSHRYDYAYPDQELDEWGKRIAEMAEKASVVFSFSNNCHMGSSYVDALRLKQRLGQPIRTKSDAPVMLFEADGRRPYVETLARQVAAAHDRERDVIATWREMQGEDRTSAEDGAA